MISNNCNEGKKSTTKLKALKEKTNNSFGNNNNNKVFSDSYRQSSGYSDKGYGCYFLNGGKGNFNVLDYEVWTKQTVV